MMIEKLKTSNKLDTKILEGFGNMKKDNDGELLIQYFENPHMNVLMMSKNPHYLKTGAIIVWNENTLECFLDCPDGYKRKVQRYYDKEFCQWVMENNIECFPPPFVPAEVFEIMEKENKPEMRELIDDVRNGKVRTSMENIECRDLYVKLKEHWGVMCDDDEKLY